MRPTRRCTATFPPTELLSTFLPFFALPCYRTTRCSQYRLSTRYKPDFLVDQSKLLMRSELPTSSTPGAYLLMISSVVSPSDSNTVNADVPSASNTEQKFKIRLKGMFLVPNYETFILIYGLVPKDLQLHGLNHKLGSTYTVIFTSEDGTINVRATRSHFS
jgi:hypothetical protein